MRCRVLCGLLRGVLSRVRWRGLAKVLCRVLSRVRWRSLAKVLCKGAAQGAVQGAVQAVQAVRVRLGKKVLCRAVRDEAAADSAVARSGSVQG